MRLPAAIGCLLCLHASALRGQTAVPASRGLRVIGVGHQRTGTESLTAALLMLGYNPAHGVRFIVQRPYVDPFTGQYLLPPGTPPYAPPPPPPPPARAPYAPPPPPPRAPPVLNAASRAVSFLQRGEAAGAAAAELRGYPLEIMNRTVLDAWMSFANGNSFEAAYKTLLDNGFDSTTADVPMYGAAKELIARNPGAKVILQVHPRGANGWVDSMTNMCWKCRNGFDGWMSTYGGIFSACVREMMHYGDDINATVKEACAREYEEQNAELRRLVPPERLLVFSPADGWGPLCKFLQAPVPLAPFPRVQQYGSRRRRTRDSADRKRVIAERKAQSEAAARMAAKFR